MKRRLTIAQRQAIIRWGTLLLSIALLAGVFYVIPYVVRAIPKMSTATSRAMLSGSAAMGIGTPDYALGGGAFETSQPNTDDVGQDGEYEPEDPIPIPESGEGDLTVTASNLAWYEINEPSALNLINRTDFNVDLQSFLGKPFPVVGALQADAPLVLIVHTHGSESYLENGYSFYSPEETFRSLEEEKTVVHIGEVLCEKLNSLGISTVHDKTMYDQTDFNKSYNYAREGIKKVLAEYPTIRFVIDLHRDSVFDSKGNNIKPLTTLNGKDCAQLMLVVGTNQGGSDHPNWRDNLTFATHLQQKMNDLYPTLARPINLRSAAFNQALTKGSVILEVGSCGNTIEEAENAVLLFAQAYASVIKENLK
ncbi:MAG: stage II sporulation protein P [Clostridia bacterium]|nr:stage II sporulation protein P [Clostridia bacterium]